MKTQRKFRKALSLLLSLAFVLSMASLPVAVNAYDPATVTASTVEGADGANVVVSISITPNSGLGTGTMLIKYDTTKLTYVSRTFGPAQGELNGFNPNYATDGNLKTIYYAPVHTEGITEGGAMVNITFNCVTGWTGAAAIELTASEMVDATYAPISFSTVNGSVNIPTPVTPKTITFDSAGGTAVAPITGMPGDPVTAPAAPTKVGYDFDGWDPALPAEIPDNDVTLTAQWTPADVFLTVAEGMGAAGDTVEIAVDISANSGLAAADLFLAYDNTKLTFVSALAGPATAGGISSIAVQPAVGDFTTIKQGFAIDGGLSAGGSLMVVTFTINPGWPGSATPLTLTYEDFFNDDYDMLSPVVTNGEVVCTAPLTSTITFDTAGGSAIAPVTGEPGTDVPAVTDPVKPYYVFAGWEPGIPATFPSNDLTVVAQWTAEAPIVFKAADVTGAEGDNVVVSISITPDSGLGTGTILLKYDTTKLAYVSKSFGPAAGEINGFNENYANDGDFRTIYYAPVHTEGIIEGGVMINITFTVLAGWTGASALELTANEVVDKFYTPMPFTAEDGSVTVLEAPVQSTVTFDTAGGSTIAPVTGDVGTPLPGIADPTKPGYTFTGWTPALPAVFPDNDVTLTAGWALVPVTLTASDETGAVGENVDVTVSITGNSGLAAADIFLTFDNTKLEFVSAVAGTATAGGISSINEQVPAGDFTAIKQGFAHDEGITAAGSMMIVTFTIKAGWTGTTPVTLSVEDFFNSSYAAVVPTFDDGSVTCTTPLTSTITFNTDGGSLIDPITQDEGTAVTAPAAPTKTGYTFASWLPEVPAVMPADDVTCVAQWTINSYDAIFMVDGTEYDRIPTEFGAVIQLPAVDPSKPGFTFTGWSPTPGTMGAADETFEAMWETIPTYTITFNTDGGSAIDPIIGYAGDPVTEPAAPTKTGYTFTGWNPAIPSAFPAEDLTVVAQWTVNSYTITFDSMGGSAVDAITQEFSTAVAEPADPMRTGYTFTGWTPAVPATMPAEDTLCVAQWSINSYIISFNTMGGTPVADIEQEFGTAVTPPAPPTKAGFTFAGWVPEVPATMPGTDTTCVAQWDEIVVTTSTITFNTDGGSLIDPITGEVGTDVTAPAAPTKTGYTFMGWSPDLPATFPADDLTVTAQWQINEYTISFDSAGGSMVDAITQDYATSVTAPTEPTKNGYTFAGWVPEVPAIMPAENTFCVAQWTINTYTLTFNGNGGIPAIVEITDEFGSAITPPADPTREGYTFTGWDTEIPATMPSANLFIYATWAINEYTISFDSAGGSAVAPITQDFGTDVTAPADPTKPGFTFAGWLPEVPATMPAANTTCVAQWTAIPTSTITFNTDGGSLIDPITGYSGDPLTEPAAPTKTGYTFTGWDPALPSVFPQGDLTVMAQWTPINYTITWNANNGAGSVIETLAYGTTPVPPTVTRTGYTFAGWTPTIATVTENATYDAQWTINTYPITFDASGGTGGWSMDMEYGATITPPVVTREGYTFNSWSPTPTATVEGAAIYYAMWDINSYTVTFDSAGGSAVAPITQQFGTAVAAPAAPTKFGYTFAGWLPTVPTAMPAANTNCVAQWTPNTYDATFYVDGGIYATVPTVFGQQIVLPADPTKTGYTFIEWVERVESAEKSDQVFVMDEEGLDFDAVFEVNSYTITFDSAGGTAVAPITQDFGTTVTAPAAPARTGYIFAGWLPTVPATMPAENTTCVAQWTAMPTSTITFDTAGGSAIAPMTGYMGDPVTPPANPTKAGYVFAGWSPAIPATFPQANITVTAQWTPVANPTVEITLNGVVLCDDYRVQVLWCKSYCKETLQLGYATNVDAPARVEFTSDNAKVKIDQTGKITNTGIGCRSANITVNVYDEGGNVIATDTVKVTFYKNIFDLLFGWIMVAAMAVVNAFHKMLVLFNSL